MDGFHDLHAFQCRNHTSIMPEKKGQRKPEIRIPLVYELLTRFIGHNEFRGFLTFWTQRKFQVKAYCWHIPYHRFHLEFEIVFLSLYIHKPASSVNRLEHHGRKQSIPLWLFLLWVVSRGHFSITLLLPLHPLLYRWFYSILSYCHPITPSTTHVWQLK